MKEQQRDIHILDVLSLLGVKQSIDAETCRQAMFLTKRGSWEPVIECVACLPLRQMRSISELPLSCRKGDFCKLYVPVGLSCGLEDHAPKVQGQFGLVSRVASSVLLKSHDLPRAHAFLL